MRFFTKVKDGGPDSNVDAYIPIEMKSLFTVALLKFNKGGREAFHTHAFTAFTWFLKGDMLEETKSGETSLYKHRLWPKLTRREKFHRVLAFKDSWCFTIRGRWKDTWKEYDSSTNLVTTLTHGREVVKVEFDK